VIHGLKQAGHILKFQEPRLR